MVRFAAAFVAAALVALVSPALSSAAGVKIGDEAPTYSKLDGVDGKSHSLADLKGKDVVVVCITCNHCPMAIKYEDRIIDFVKKNASGDSKVSFVAINVNNNDNDKLDKMIERSKEKGYNFSYIYDPSQKIAKDLGATVTPHFFVFNKERKLIYKGAMDDNTNPDSAKVNYVELAVKAGLKGEMPEKTETKAVGCGVQYGK